MVKTLTDTELEYYAIIENRRNNPLPKGEYGEIHHIHPRSCGGSDCECNLVKLTPEEHYRCHCLLPKIFEEKGMLKEKDLMCLAWHLLHTTREGVKLSESEYSKLKTDWHSALNKSLKNGWTEERKKIFSVRRKGKGNPAFGKHWKLSEETKKRMSEARKGNGHPVSEETKKKISDSWKRRKEAK